MKAISNCDRRAKSIASPPCAASVTSSGKRVAEKILRTMPRMVVESSTTNTRLGSRTRVAPARRRVASSRPAGMLAKASVWNCTVAPGAQSSTVKGGLAAARAVDVILATASSPSALSKNARSTPEIVERFADATPSASRSSMGIGAAATACRNMSRSLCEPEATTTRRKNRSSVMRSSPERV